MQGGTFMWNVNVRNHGRPETLTHVMRLSPSKLIKTCKLKKHHVQRLLLYFFVIVISLFSRRFLGGIKWRHSWHFVCTSALSEIFTCRLQLWRHSIRYILPARHNLQISPAIPTNTAAKNSSILSSLWVRRRIPFRFHQKYQRKCHIFHPLYIFGPTWGVRTFLNPLVRGVSERTETKFHLR